MFVICSLLILINTKAQDRPTINHIALYVFDLKKSVDFYKNVLQFEQIDDPFHDGKHVWLKIGEHAQLHIIEGAKEVLPHDINSHFAYTVTVLDKFIAHLNEVKIKYQNFKGEAYTPQLRPDGIRQVYFQDPDNNWIEVNDDKF